MIKPGPRNLITDVAGIKVGNAEDHRVRTGVTVVLPDAPALAAVDVRGGAPGTRETDALQPANRVDRIDAVVLSGGSVFGLDAAGAIVPWLAARGRGLEVGGMVVPIVPAAILFDLANGGDKSWGEAPPYRDLGLRAAAAAASTFALGNAGAGLGAVAGRLKGGLGSASAVGDDGLQVGALVAANPVGSAVMPVSATLWAWALEQGDEMGGQPLPTAGVGAALDLPADGKVAANTTIGVVATNWRLSKADALRVAIMAHDGIARAIRPAHAPQDGDTIFVLSTGAMALPSPEHLSLARLGSIAADCVTRAIGRAVYLAEPLGGYPSYRSLHGAQLRGTQRT
jgi:L-aminopeptidase/D-esterase-like protein